MSTYEELKNELLNIASIVDKYPESVKPQVFNLLIEHYLGVKPNKGKTKPNRKTTKKTVNEQHSTPKTKKKKKASQESYKIDKNLNLRGGKDNQSFKDFYSEKSPKTAMQFNAVSIYYLANILELEEVTFDQLYTCYKEVNFKQPKYFRQSITDTKNQKGWVDIDENDNLSIPHRGVAYVEDDLPSSKK